MDKKDLLFIFLVFVVVFGAVIAHILTKTDPNSGDSSLNSF